MSNLAGTQQNLIMEDETTTYHQIPALDGNVLLDQSAGAEQSKVVPHATQGPTAEGRWEPRQSAPIADHEDDDDDDRWASTAVFQAWSPVVSGQTTMLWHGDGTEGTATSTAVAADHQLGIAIAAKKQLGTAHNSTPSVCRGGAKQLGGDAEAVNAMLVHDGRPPLDCDCDEDVDPLTHNNSEQNFFVIANGAALPAVHSHRRNSEEDAVDFFESFSVGSRSSCGAGGASKIHMADDGDDCESDAHRDAPLQTTFVPPPPPPVGATTTSAAARHNDIDDDLDSVAETNLFVSGLAPEMDDDALYKLFRRFGPICLCEVVRDPTTAASRCVGFVQFVDAASANEARRQMNLYTVQYSAGGGDEADNTTNKQCTAVAPEHRRGASSGATTVTLRVRHACEERNAHANHAASGSGRSSAGLGSGSGSGNDLLAAGSGSAKGGPPLETNKIFVRRVPLTATTKRLASYFSQFGSVTSCTIHKDISRKGMMERSTTNMAYVTFVSTREAERTSRMEHRNVPLGDEGAIVEGPLVVKLAETLARRNHRLSAQQQQQQQHHQQQQQQPVTAQQQPHPPPPTLMPLQQQHQQQQFLIQPPTQQQQNPPMPMMVLHDGTLGTQGRPYYAAAPAGTYGMPLLTTQPLPHVSMPSQGQPAPARPTMYAVPGERPPHALPGAPGQPHLPLIDFSVASTGKPSSMEPAPTYDAINRSGGSSSPQFLMFSTTSNPSAAPPGHCNLGHGGSTATASSNALTASQYEGSHTTMLGASTYSINNASNGMQPPATCWVQHTNTQHLGSATVPPVPVMWGSHSHHQPQQLPPPQFRTLHQGITAQQGMPYGAFEHHGGAQQQHHLSNGGASASILYSGGGLFQGMGVVGPQQLQQQPPYGGATPSQRNHHHHHHHHHHPQTAWIPMASSDHHTFQPAMATMVGQPPQQRAYPY